VISVQAPSPAATSTARPRSRPSPATRRTPGNHRRKPNAGPRARMTAASLVAARSTDQCSVHRRRGRRPHAGPPGAGGTQRAWLGGQCTRLPPPRARQRGGVGSRVEGVKVHLVDATYELFRAYFAWPSAKGNAGQEVNAAKGLVSTLRRLVATPGVTHVACAFDHVIESFRNQLFPGYKTGEGLDPNLLGQFGLVER